MTDQTCVACGKEEAILDGMCIDCLQTSADMNPDIELINPGDADDFEFYRCTDDLDSIYRGCLNV